MKTKTLFFTAVLLTTSCMGQVMSYMTSLKTSDSGITVAELSLVHRSRSNYKDIKDLGKRLVQISNQPNGIKIDIEHYRFITRVGSAYEMHGTVYVPVHLYHDNKTDDPKDDLYLLSMPFPVEKELILDELNHYDGEELITANFVNAPKGPPLYELRDEKIKQE